MPPLFIGLEEDEERIEEAKEEPLRVFLAVDLLVKQ